MNKTTNRIEGACAQSPDLNSYLEVAVEVNCTVKVKDS